MAKQFVIVTKDPKAGHPQWTATGTTFSNLAAAENCKRGTIECLQRPDQRIYPSDVGNVEAAHRRAIEAAKKAVEGREWAIVEIDFADMMGPLAWLERVKWAVRYMLFGPRLYTTGMSEKDMRDALKGVLDV